MFPPVAAFPIYKLLCFIYSFIFGTGSVYQSVLAGLFSGYIIYDMTHYYIHHAKPSIEYFKEMKAYHVLHHYKEPENGFGISAKLWDYVFGTVIEQNK